MIKLSAMRGDVRTATVKIGGDEMTISYLPNAYTPRLEADAAQAQGGQQAGPVLITILREVLTAWEITDDKGRMLPIDDKTLAEIPMPVLTDMLRVIGEDMNPQKKTSTPSGGSF